MPSPPPCEPVVRVYLTCCLGSFRQVQARDGPLQQPECVCLQTHPGLALGRGHQQHQEPSLGGPSGTLLRQRKPHGAALSSAVVFLCMVGSPPNDTFVTADLYFLRISDVLCVCWLSFLVSVGCGQVALAPLFRAALAVEVRQS